MNINSTQLLCTFTSTADLENTISVIKNSYSLVFNKLYVLENIADANQLILTYNITKPHANTLPPNSTISVHRKKLTNTIYTINAINKLIEMKNNGVLDKSYKIDWSELQNAVLVTAYSQLKIINTNLIEIVEL
jgi:hypothetical protein